MCLRNPKAGYCPVDKRPTIKLWPALSEAVGQLENCFSDNPVEFFFFLSGDYIGCLICTLEGQIKQKTIFFLIKKKILNKNWVSLQGGGSVSFLFAFCFFGFFVLFFFLMCCLLEFFFNITLFFFISVYLSLFSSLSPQFFRFMRSCPHLVYIQKKINQSLQLRRLAEKFIG